jgi:hypothetical protein
MDCEDAGPNTCCARFVMEGLISAKTFPDIIPVLLRRGRWRVEIAG